MKGMTGFGSAEYKDEKLQLSLNLKSYNNRFLDIVVFLPANLDTLEQRCRSFLSARFQRGRVELYLKARVLEEQTSVYLDKGNVTSYMKALRSLAEIAGIKEEIRLSHLLRIEGILKTEKSEDMATYWRFVEPLLENGFEKLEQMRIEEGEATRADIESKLKIIDLEIVEVKGNVSLIEHKIKERLKVRFYELLGEGVDESRVYSETAVQLVRCDINEELVRINTYLTTFKEVLDQPGAIGKKLDFICQELNREVNTIGSKSMLREVDSAVVSIKDGLEKIREQLRNVE